MRTSYHHVAFGACWGSSVLCMIVKAKFGKKDRKKFWVC